MTQTIREKSILLALLLGLLLPGLGLFYAAPLGVAAVGSIVALLTYKLFAWIPIIGKVVVGLLALCSAALSVGYARMHNQQAKVAAG